jgi:hypothetical protein
VNFCYCSSPWESNLILELNWILKYYNKLNKIGICGCILLHNELFYNLLSKMKISYLDIRIDDKYVGEFHSKGFKVLLTSQAKTLNELEIVICGYLNSSLFRKLNILENLTKLTIEQNMSSEYVYFYDFKNLQNLKKLVHLNLKGYQISFKSIESLFHSFAFFTILETLSLTNCSPKIFENNNLSWKNLFHLKKLVSFDISIDHFGKLHMEVLEIICSMTNLIFLNLKNVHLPDIANDSFKKLEDNDQLESWVQAKITKAADYLNSVTQYLKYQSVKPGMTDERLDYTLDK